MCGAPLPLRPAHALVVGLFASAVSAGCHDGDRSGARTGAAGSEPSSRTGPSGPIEALLPAHHRDFRADFGPHRLVADIELRVKRKGGDGDRAVSIDDHVELAWRPDALSLVHRNDHDRSHEMRIVGKRVFTRLAHRPWYETPLETDAHEAWLDEVLRIPHDALAFLGPAARLVPAEDGASYRLEPAPEAPAGGPVLDAAHGRFEAPDGGPVRFEVDATFRLPDGDVGGRLRVTYVVTPVAADDLDVAPPPDALPYPEKVRLEADRRALLEGLAPLASP